MFSTSALVLAVGMAVFGAKHTGEATPSRSDISYIESKISLPSEAPGPLSSYQRYYAWTIDNGRKYIYVVLIFDDLLGPNKPAANAEHIHSVTEQEIPNISNGGCGVITFYSDPRGTRTPSLYCNPVGPSATP